MHRRNLGAIISMLCGLVILPAAVFAGVAGSNKTGPNQCVVSPGADCTNAQLQGANLQNAQLPRINLDGANLIGVTLDGANLQNASLRYADLETASLNGADLRGADLTGANLNAAHLNGTLLYGAKLNNIKVTEHDLADANLVDQNPPFPAPVEKKVTILKHVNFEFDSARLTGSSKLALKELAWDLKNNNSVVEISGHTDSVGTDAYNQALSERRAQAAVSYLIAQGVDPGRISAVGYGESQPVASNATSDGRAANRRLEMKVLR